MNRLLIALAFAAPLAAISAERAQKPVAKMDWWDVCIEHGRNIRAKSPRQEKSRAWRIEAEALSYGFSMVDEDTVLTHTPRLGMDVCAAMAAFGRPNANNRSVGSWGTDEQWVYRQRNLYLYFREGKLRSYQRG